MNKGEGRLYDLDDPYEISIGRDIRGSIMPAIEPAVGYGGVGRRLHPVKGDNDIGLEPTTVSMQTLEKRRFFK